MNYEVEVSEQAEEDHASIYSYILNELRSQIKSII